MITKDENGLYYSSARIELPNKEIHMIDKAKRYETRIITAVLILCAVAFLYFTWTSPQPQEPAQPTITHAASYDVLGPCVPGVDCRAMLPATEVVK